MTTRRSSAHDRPELARRRAVAAHLPLARQLARSNGKSHLSGDQLEAEAIAAVRQAARSWQPASGQSFTTLVRASVTARMRSLRHPA